MVLLLGVVAAGQTGESVSEVVKHSSDAVVLIVTSDAAGHELALGSGFIVSADGRVITNYHVIKDAYSAIVKLSNGASFAVEGVIASDPDKDVAVLKVPGRNLAHLQLADSGAAQIGEHVIAIGSPLGLEGTVSDGIVSAIRDEQNGKTWIQTTAPVSHGNSGGPLLNLKGDVVGVITWGVNLRVGQNLNFAIPSQIVKSVLATAHAPSPIDSPSRDRFLTASAESSSQLLSHSLWHSLSSGRDYKLRLEGDYIYAEWINLPGQLQNTGAHADSQLKKSSDGHWRGTTTSFGPFQYQDTWTGKTLVKWCRVETDIQIDSISNSRIDGVSIAFDKIDIKKCQPQGLREVKFTMIPIEQ